MSEEKKESIGPTRRTVPQIVAAMRETFGPLADPAEPSAGWDVAGDALAFADEIEEEYGRENHCAKRYDKDGDEMPPHCAFDDLKIDRLGGQVAKMRSVLKTTAEKLVRIKNEFDKFSPGECDSKNPAKWFVDEIREENPEYTDEQVVEEANYSMESCYDCDGAGCPMGALRELTKALAAECGLDEGGDHA